MGAPISGAGPGQFKPGATNNNNIDTTIESAMEAMKNESAVVDEQESAGVSGKLKTQRNESQSDVQSRMQQTQQESKQAMGKVNEQEAAKFTSAKQSDEIKKKKDKEKESASEKLMDELAQLEGQVDQSQLNEEEQGIFQQFFENMNRIRTLRGKYKRQKRELEEAKRKEKEEKEKEERKRRELEKRDKNSKEKP
tara:strand:- start:61 stop:645 length:585 start_codon:yes stop_codon:yes gene_type:complete